MSPLLSDGSCLKNEAEGLASWLSVTAIAGKSDKGTRSHKISSDLHTQTEAHMYPCIQLHINKQQTFNNNNKIRSLVQTVPSLKRPLYYMTPVTVISLSKSECWVP